MVNQKPSENDLDKQAFDETIAHDGSTGADSGDDFATDAIPESLGRYRIEKILGRGGMGAVYLAHDGQLDRKVALKIPRFGSSTDEKLVARFYREARSAANLSHPNLCPVFDVGEIDGTHYIAMAYIQGRTLSDYVNAAKPPPAKVTAALIRKVAIAMEEAHQSGILHRDLKPANIMVDQRKEPVVMDFGLACPQDSGDDTRLTQDGTLLGSPAYMSPEQLRGQPDAIGKASDVYSLGVVLYELLAGRLPFHDASSTIAMISRILSEQPTDISELRSEVDPALAAICRKAMSKNVSERFDSMAAFAEALGKYIKSDRGGSGKLAEPTPVGAADVSRIQLTEQSRLAKTLCESGQLVAALPILKQIIANPQGQEADGQDTKMVQWAKATLPQVQARMTQQSKKKVAVEDDLFANLPAATVQTTPHRSAPRKRHADRDRKVAGSRHWLAITGAGIIAVLFAAVGALVFFSGSKEASSGSADPVMPAAKVTAIPSEPEAAKNEIAKPSRDRGGARRQGRKFLMEQADPIGDGGNDATEAAAFEAPKPTRREREFGGLGPGRNNVDGRGDVDGRSGRERLRPPEGLGPERPGPERQGPERQGPERPGPERPGRRGMGPRGLGPRN